MFLRIFQHLLPNAKAWRITVDKQLRQFFQGLTGLGSDIRTFIDLVFRDIDPQETRELDAWEAQWGLPSNLTVEQERRDRLDATWKALGGQDPRYIQDTLQAAGFDVYVHEWWADMVPTVRNPFTYLNDGTQPTQYIANCGAQKANCGHSEANCGASTQPRGYPLVNKVVRALIGNITAGMQVANCGAAQANCNSEVTSYRSKQYIIPNDSTKWPYFLYIGGAAFPDMATVPSSRRNEFETLCLKICPTQQWLGILVEYS